MGGRFACQWGEQRGGQAGAFCRLGGGPFGGCNESNERVREDERCLRLSSLLLLHVAGGRLIYMGENWPKRSSRGRERGRGSLAEAERRTLLIVSTKL